MEEQLQEDWLDRRLREEMAYIDDDGFTARVVQKLPPPPRRHSFRAAILLSVTVLASLLAYILSDGGRFLAVEAYRLASLPLFLVSLIAIGCTLAVTAAAASAAWSSARR